MRSISRFRSSEVPRWSSQYVVNPESFCSFFSFIKIVTFCQDWIVNNVIPPEEVVGSLAVQMNQRALDQERVRTFSLFLFMFLFNPFQARHEREMEEAEREEERANRAAQELDEQIQADAMRQLMVKEQQYKARKRANSEATEVPFMGEGDFQVPTEVFSHEMEIDGVRFNAVKLFHPRSGKSLPFSFPLLFIESLFSSWSRVSLHSGSCCRWHCFYVSTWTLRCHLWISVLHNHSRKEEIEASRARNTKVVYGSTPEAYHHFRSQASHTTFQWSASIDGTFGATSSIVFTRCIGG